VRVFEQYFNEQKIEQRFLSQYKALTSWWIKFHQRFGHL